MVKAETIKLWCDIVNKKMGWKVDWKYYDSFKDSIILKEFSYGYVACLPLIEHTGIKSLYVLSWWIDPSMFTPPAFFQIQDEIKKIAKKEKCNYIRQYSDYNPKLNRLLIKRYGYKVSELKVEV